MDNKRIICIRGNNCIGKTTLINNVVEVIKSKPYCFVDMTTEIIDKMGLKIVPPGKQDCWLLLKNGGYLIIIQSEGDLVKSFKNTRTYLNVANDNNVLVLCALRTNDPKTSRLEEELDKIKNKCDHQCEYIGLSDRSDQGQSQEHTLQMITKWFNS